MVNYISKFTEGEATPDVLTNPGDYRVLDFTIEGKNGKVSIPNKLVGFTIYENLFTPYMTAEFLLLDTDNLPSLLPLEGGEKIEVKIVDCLKVERTNKFRVTKVTERSPVSPSSITYMIHATSEVVVNSHANAISRSVINKLAEEEIEQILSDLKFDGKFYSSESTSPICFMIPNWRPMKAVSWISRRSISKQFADSPYVTFMTINEDIYHLPLDLLYKSPKRKNLTWKANKSGVGGGIRLQNDPRMEEHLYSFLDFNVYNTSNTLQNLSSGMFKTRVQMIELFSRTDVDDFYDYADEFGKTEHLGTTPIELYDIEVGNESFWRTIYQHTGHFSQEKSESTYAIHSSSHNSKMQQMKNFVIHGKLPGHTDLSVGQKYNIRVPSFSDSLDYQQEDPYLSGDYVIEAIKHDFFHNNQYTVSIKAFRDSSG